MRIAPHHIHLWHCTLSPDQNDINTYLQLLDDEEIKHARQFHYDIHRNRYISAHGMLRKILATYLKCDAKSIRFTVQALGKPSVAFPETTLQFNLSHSHNKFVCAISHSTPVGIDIEKIKPRCEEKIAAKEFTDSEYRTFAAVPPDQKTAAFYFLWTAKEAVIKAVGLGLHTSFKSFSVNIHAVNQLISLPNYTLKLISLHAPDDFKMALACDLSIDEIIYYHFDHDAPVVEKIEILT